MSPNDEAKNKEYLSLLKSNYENLHKSVWEAHGVAWKMTRVGDVRSERAYCHIKLCKQIELSGFATNKLSSFIYHLSVAFFLCF